MNRKIRNIIFILLGIAFYLLWNYGGDRFYGKFIAFGIEHIVSKKSDITSATVNYFKSDDQYYIAYKYPKGESGVSMESYLPVVLLFAWQIALFFDKRINMKKALWLFAINFLIIYLLQITYPLVMRSKSSLMFIGTQIFSFLVFFIILKDTFIIRLKR
ncbi:hypothetical protein [uncultured Draconibacterium sp.]|uniref:hypothetical protein n=1 Tax=uncultured Draconibacterium sp. TaxID=1573823 RepID=UPI0025EBF72D|nr:hypothetical protein [uncultured Draconibacterium sp.]